MQQNILLIQQYIKEKPLIPISGLYIVNLNEIKTQDELNKYETDIYLSINPNII